MQLAINISISACLFALAAAGISLAQATTRQIPFTLAAAMSTSAYVCHGLHSAGWPLLTATLVATAVGAIIACVLDFALMRPLDGHAQAVWAAVAVSLGAYMVVQATLAMVFGEAGRTFAIPSETYALGDARITRLQLALVGISVGVIGGLLAFLRFARSGLAIRGLASNADLCELLGIRTSVVRGIAVSTGGALTSLATILTAGDSGLVPSTGFTLFLSGVTAAILAGVGSAWGVAGGALLLAAARHLVAYFGDPKWMDAVAFLILIGFLIWKPLGFSGRRLKKVEV